MQKKNKTYSILPWIIACIIIFTSCARITIPDSDSTPPKVILNVLGHDIEVVSGGSPQTAKTDSYARDDIMVYGTDRNGGVKRVWITGTVRVSCDGDGHAPSDRPYNSDERLVTATIGDTVRETLFQNLGWETSDWEEYNNCHPERSNNYTLTAVFIGHAENFHGLTSTTPPLSLTFIPCHEGLPCTGHPRDCWGRPDFRVTGRTVCDDEGDESCQFLPGEHYCSSTGGRCGLGQDRICNNHAGCAPGYFCLILPSLSRQGECVRIPDCPIPDGFCWTFDELVDPSLLDDYLGPCRYPLSR